MADENNTVSDLADLKTLSGDALSIRFKGDELPRVVGQTRALELALALMRRCIAGPGFDLDAEIHLADRCLDIAGDVDRERL